MSKNQLNTFNHWEVEDTSMNDYFVDKIVDWALDKNQET